MNRITEIDIAGKTYPLNFSTRAAKQMAARYGGMDQIDTAFEGKGIDEMLDDVIWMLALLIDQGVAYRRIIDGVQVDAVSADDLEVLLGMGDLVRIKDVLLEAMLAGAGREVEAEPDPKNAEATQEQ